MVLEKLYANQRVQMVDDVVWQPTYAPECAQAIWKLVEQGHEGETFHVAGPDRMSMYAFAVEVAKAFNRDAGLIEPVPSTHFPGIAPRPRDTSYDLSKIKRLGIELSGVKEGLRKMGKDRP